MGESIHRSRRSECVNAAVADKIDVAPRRSRTMDIQQANPSHWSTYQLSCRGVCDHVVLGQHPVWVWQGDIAAVDAGVHLKLVAQAFLAAACMIYGSHGWMDHERKGRRIGLWIRSERRPAVRTTMASKRLQGAVGHTGIQCVIHCCTLISITFEGDESATVIYIPELHTSCRDSLSLIARTVRQSPVDRIKARMTCRIVISDVISTVASPQDFQFYRSVLI